MSTKYSLEQFQYPHTNLADFVLENVTNRPETDPVYVDSVTGECITYYRLKLLVSCFHGGLRRMGLNKGDCVCFFAPNNIYMAPIYIGTMAAGCTISPANTSYVASELQRQLQVSEAKLLIVHPNNLDTALQAAASAGIPLSHVLALKPDPAGRVPTWNDVMIDYKDKDLPNAKLTQEESRSIPAYLCFSSGTTGKSKGVMTSHYNVISMVTEASKAGFANAKVSGKKTLLALVPLYHFAGIHRIFNSAIRQGSSVVVVEKYSVPAMCEAIERFKITDFSTAPPILIHLLNNPIVDKYDMSSLRSISVGSAPVSPDTVRRILKKFGVPCLQGYGMTEVSPVITFQTPENVVPESVGQLIPCMEAKIVDPSTGRELGVGEAGELIVRGPNVMIGYKGDPASTASAIDKDGWLHTGDIMRKDEKGNYYIVDRIKELIKFKGFQVAPVELESVLLECPYVADAGVIGIYDERQATEIPLAYVVLTPDGKKAGSTETVCRNIREWVDGRVAPHKRLRGGVRVIDAIPKSEAGKILRRDMKAIYEREKKDTSPSYSARL